MEYPKCFQYILSHMKNSDTREKSAFILSFIQFLVNSGITGYEEISSQLDVITLYAQRNFVDRNELLSFTEINGKNYNIDSDDVLSDYMAALFDACEKPLSFDYLFQFYGFTDGSLCLTCPFGTHYSSAHRDSELKVAYYMLQSQDNMDQVLDLCPSEIDKFEFLFQSQVDIYNILSYGSDFFVFNGLYTLMRSVYKNPLAYYMFDMNSDLNMLSGTFILELAEQRLSDDILELGGDKKQNIIDIYNYLLEQINSIASEDISFSEIEEIVASFNNRAPYVPVVNADATPVSYTQLSENTFVSNRNSLNEIHEEKSTEKKTIRRRGKTLEVYNASTYENDVFEEEDVIEYTLSSSESSSIVGSDVVEKLSGEVIDIDGNLADPNKLMDENSAEDLDDIDIDGDDDFGFSFSNENSSTFPDSNTETVIDETVMNDEGLDEACDECADETDTIEDNATPLLTDELAVGMDFTDGFNSADELEQEQFDEIYLSDNDFISYEICSNLGEPFHVLPVYKEEPLCSELNRIQSKIMNVSAVYAEPVLYENSYYILFILDSSMYLSELLTFLRITNRKSVKILSGKPFLMYSIYSSLDNENHYRTVGKIKGVVPVLEVLKNSGYSYYSSIPTNFKKRAAYLLSLYLDNSSLFDKDDAMVLSNYVSALGYSFNRRRYISALSEQDDLYLFRLVDGNITFNGLNKFGVIRNESLKKKSYLFAIQLSDTNEISNEDFGGIFGKLLATLSEKGDVRNLPFQLLSCNEIEKELVFFSMKYCYSYIRTLLLIYLDQISHEYNIKDLQLMIKVLN